MCTDHSRRHEGGRNMNKCQRCSGRARTLVAVSVLAHRISLSPAAIVAKRRNGLHSLRMQPGSVVAALFTCMLPTASQRRRQTTGSNRGTRRWHSTRGNVARDYTRLQRARMLRNINQEQLVWTVAQDIPLQREYRKLPSVLRDRRCIL